MWRTPPPLNTNIPTPLRHVDGSPVLRLLRVFRHPAASSEEDSRRLLLPTLSFANLPTRPGFPGSPDDTQTFLFRPQPLFTYPAACRFP